MLVVNDRIQVPLRELDFAFSKSRGPGGQNVNKVNTKATLRWTVAKNSSLPEAVRQRFLTRYRTRLTKNGQLVLSSQRFRDQGRNVADCLARLRGMLEGVAQPPKKRRPTKPKRSSVERRLRNKREKSERKQQRGRIGTDD